MMRSLYKYILTVLMLATTLVAVGQNVGVQQPEENALNLAFQSPEKWSGKSYSSAVTFLERSFVLVGIGTDGIWGMSELFGGKTGGFYGALDFGHWVAPIHGYEIGFSYGMLPVIDWKTSRFGTNYKEESYTRYFNISTSYLLNITSYAQKRQHPGRWEVIAKMGLDMRFQDLMSLGLHTSLRCQYNVTPEFGLYLAPQVGLYTNALDNERVAASYPIHILPSISAGFVVRLERSERYRKREYVTASDRVRAYVARKGTDRSRVEKIFGPRINDEILRDTIDVSEPAQEVQTPKQTSPSESSFVMPTDSAGLAKYRVDSIKRVTSLRADSVRRVVMLKDSLKQIAIMRKDSAGRATLIADSLRRLESVRADSVMRAERAKMLADSLLQAEREWNHKFHCGKVALSTNLLYWAAAMPNIGLEVPIKNRYSVALEYVCQWVANRAAGFSYRLLNWDLEGRYWFNNTNQLRGLFVGAYGSLGYYDFGQKDTGHQGHILSSAGVSAGYSLPLGKTVSLEMSMGVGVLNTTYSNYHEDDGYLVYDSKRAYSIMGPTKATVGITWSPEFDFNNTAMFNKSIRDENRVVRSEHRVERDAERVRSAAKAQVAYEQEVEWRGERSIGRLQMKIEKEEERIEDKANRDKEREKKRIAAAKAKAKARDSIESVKLAAKEQKSVEKGSTEKGSKVKESTAESTAEKPAMTERELAKAAQIEETAMIAKVREKAAADAAKATAKADAAFEKEYAAVSKKNRDAVAKAKLMNAQAKAQAKLAKAKGEPAKKVEAVKPVLTPLPKRPKAVKAPKMSRDEISEAQKKAAQESDRAARQLILQMDDMEGLL